MPVGKDARDYQIKAAGNVFAEYRAGRTSTLVVQPTGTGKTFTAAVILANYNAGRTLFLAPTEEIVRQTANLFRETLPHRRTAIEMQEYRSHSRTDAHIVVATVASMVRRLKKYGREHFTQIIDDESHHAVCATSKAIAQHFAPGLKHQLGLTATPDRHDGVALGNVYQSTAFEMQIYEAQDLGWLVVPQQQYAPSSRIDLRKVHRVGRDFNQKELASVLEQAAAIEHIVSNAIRVSDGRKTALYCHTVLQAKQVSEKLQRLGEPHVYIDGKTPKPARRERIASFTHGRPQYLVNCAACTEGLDVPKLEVIALSRPLQSRALFAQIVGRGLRPFTAPAGETPEQRLAELRQQGKRALVLDFVGNMGKHLLCSVGDLLGGTFSDEVRRAARKIAQSRNGPVDMRAIYREAQDRVNRQAAKRSPPPTAGGEFRQQALEEQHKELLYRYRPHPYDVLGIDRKYAATAVPQNQAYGSRQQDAVRILEELQLQIHEIQRLTNPEQIFLSDILQARKRGGLCSWRQAVQLHKFGYDTNVGVMQASKLMHAIRMNKWNRLPDDGPNSVLQSLIGQRHG